MPQLIPAVRTRLTRPQILSACRGAYTIIMERAPDDSVACLLAAQACFETANGQSLWNYNAGNVKLTKGWKGDWYTIPCTENLGGGLKRYAAGSPQCLFRAYSDAPTGFVNFILVIKNRSTWWAALHSGDPATYNRALSTKPYRYYTGDPDEYLAGMRSIFKSLGGVEGARSGIYAPAPFNVEEECEKARTIQGALPVIRQGDSGDTVRLWQRIIEVNDDGKFGPVTDARTKEWQREQLLLADGIVGPRTWGCAP